MSHTLKIISLVILTLLSHVYGQSQTVEAGADRSICLGDNVQLDAGDATSYSWSPSTGLSNIDISDPVASPITTTTYTLNSIDLDGNASVDTITIFVISELNVSAGSNQTICQGVSVSVGSDTELDVTYSWSPEGNLSDPDISNPIATPAETTTYTLMADNGSCHGEDQITINVQAIKVDFEYIIFPSCESYEIQFVNLSDPAQYLWNFWDGSTSTETSPIIHLNQQQDIFVTLHETQSNCNFDHTLNIPKEVFKELNKFSATNVFSPNGDGINDYMDIGITGNLSECMVFEIYNRWGERVFTSQGGNTRWDGYTVAGQLVAPGTYFYSVKIKDQDYRGSVQVMY